MTTPATNSTFYTAPGHPATWFFDNKIRVFPIKPKDKIPDCKSWDDYTATREQVARFQNYGVALGLLAVADSDSTETELWASTNLPPTPFIVATARGRHRYYRVTKQAPNFFHRADLTMEFRNTGQYVVGPGSIHKSGAVYTPDPWSWNILDIPIFPVNDFQFDDRTQGNGSQAGDPLILPPVIKAGERHHLMFRLMRSLQARGVALPDVLAACQAENRIKCSPPIDSKELDTYIRRVSKYADRPGFDRKVQDDWTLAAGLLDMGVDLQTLKLPIEPTVLPNLPGVELTLEEPPDEDWWEVPSVLAETPAVSPSEGATSQPSQPSVAEESAPTPAEESAPTPAEESAPTPAGKKAPPVIHSCKQCTHAWITKSARPKRCPECLSDMWDKDEVDPQAILGEQEVTDAEVVDQNHPFFDDGTGQIVVDLEYELADELFDIETFSPVVEPPIELPPILQVAEPKTPTSGGDQ